MENKAQKEAKDRRKASKKIAVKNENSIHVHIAEAIANDGAEKGHLHMTEICKYVKKHAGTMNKSSVGNSVMDMCRAKHLKKLDKKWNSVSPAPDSKKC
eukprot:UN24718